MKEIIVSTRRYFRSLLIGVLLLTAGCAAVGPNYTRPEPQSTGHWHTDLGDGLTANPPDPKTIAQWWTGLKDPVLSELIARAVDGNLDLAAARSRIREARARRGLSAAGAFPTMDATGSVVESRGSENAGSGRENRLYSAGFDAGWELDVFGGVRRSVEAADADLAAAGEDLHDVLVSLTAETALNYIDARTFQGRIAVAERNIGIQAETYALARSRYEAGIGNELAAQQARYNLESSRSQVPLLRSGLDSAKNRLAVLLGVAPGAFSPELTAEKPLPIPPMTVAVGVPAETLRRRPDVRRDERRLAARTAQIGVAVADLYPKFQLSGTIGLESISADLFTSASRAWRGGQGVSWRIFDAGAVRKTIAVQSALQEQALIQYETTLLIALEEVENGLSAYIEDRRRRESLVVAVEAARQAMILSRDRYAAGVADFSNVLEAQRSLLSFEEDLIGSDGTVIADIVRLYKALGGGWGAWPAGDTSDSINFGEMK